MEEEPIVPPRAFPRRAIGRAVAEGMADLIPGASLLTNIYAVTHPRIEDVDRTRWERDISARSNEHSETLKRVVSAFLRMQANHQQANAAQQLSFIRGGMITTLEVIARDGLTSELETELRRKFESTSADVERLLEGLDAALFAMSSAGDNSQFTEVLHEAVFGSFGKSTIRDSILHLLRSRDDPIERQQLLAERICSNIDHFNASLMKLSKYATSSVSL